MPSTVVGREVELQELGRFLDQVVDGPAVLVLEGEAGIGKTTLWLEGLASAQQRSYRTMSARPSESEATLSFAGLGDLAQEIPPEIFDELPAPQRRALDVALLRSEAEPEPPDPRSVFVAFLGILRLLASAGPVLLAVDDLPWLDTPSSGVLQFALRRLKDERVGLLASARTTPPGATPPGVGWLRSREDVRWLPLRPLSVGAIQRVVRQESHSDLSRLTIRRVYEGSRGNPFFALELTRALIRAGGDPGPDQPLPLPDDMEQVLRTRLSRLGRRLRHVLLLASALSRPTISLLKMAVDPPERGVADIAQGVRAGVFVIEGDRVRFVHPLFASVVYSAASPEATRDVHRRLADLVVDVEEQGRHLALSVEAPDERVALVLDRAAQAATMRGAPEAAAELSRIAARLTPRGQGSDAARRRVDEAESLFRAGDSGRAEEVLRAVLAEALPAVLEVRARLLLADVMYWSNGATPAIELSEQALAAAGDDRDLRARSHADLADFLRDNARAEFHARAALDLMPDERTADPAVLAVALRNVAFAGLMLGRGLDVAPIRRAESLEAATGPARVTNRTVSQAAQWLRYVDDFEGARAGLERARAAALAEGDESSLPNTLMHLAETECWAGRWALAARYANEGWELAEQIGQVRGVFLAGVAYVDAHLGEADRARAEAGRAVEMGEHSDVHAVGLGLRALGFLELSDGNVAAAAEHLDRALGIARDTGLLEPGVWRIHGDAAQAFISIGRIDRARALIEELESRGRARDLAWSLATAARCEGLLRAAENDLVGAEAALERALQEHSRLPMPFELGRTLLAIGHVRRRSNKKRGAREPLTQALALFDRLGASLWAAQTRTELARIGGRATSSGLTGTEVQVAKLVASGRTNREVASALFIEVRTVEDNLTKIYRKLGVRSRTELTRLFVEGKLVDARR